MLGSVRAGDAVKYETNESGRTKPIDEERATGGAPPLPADPSAILPLERASELRS